MPRHEDWKKIRERIFARDGRICAYCKAAEGAFLVDHIVPLRRGGSNDEGNLCVACSPCNASKGAFLLSEWKGRKSLRDAEVGG